MVRAWVRREWLGRCLAFALLAGACPGLATAQQPARPRLSPVPRLIIMPPRVVAGAEGTLAVLDSLGRLVPNVAVELSGGQKTSTDVTGRAVFRAPDSPGTLHAAISGHNIAASAEVVSAEANGPDDSREGAASGPHVVSYPHTLAIRDRFTLEGSGFRAEADSNRVFLNGDQCLVVASSPVSLVVLPGAHTSVGDSTLHVTVAGADAGQFSVSVALLEFSGPSEAVDAGSTGELLVRARGTTRPLLLEIRNGSPAVIQLAKGNVQRLKTSGGGENVAPVGVKFVTGGNYSVSARLISEAGDVPDLESARKRLAEAREIAPSDWSARIDEILSKIDRAPRDLPQIRAELRVMLDDKPAAPLASLLDSAWRELN
jgi:hypothetical protein